MKTRIPPQESSLFATPQKARARRTDSITSFWAAQGIVCNHRQGLVLNALVQGPATQHEIIRRVREMHGENIAESTIRTGVSELADERYFSPPLVESLGPIGKSPSGRPANVWRRRVA